MLPMNIFVSAISASNPLAVYTSKVCVLHDPGSPKRRPEQPARLANLRHALRTSWADEFGDLLQVREPEVDITEAQLLRVHTADHLARVEAAYANSRPRPGGTRSFRVNLDRDTVVYEPGTRAAAYRAAGLVVKAVDDLLSSQPPSPPPAPRQARWRGWFGRMLGGSRATVAASSSPPPPPAPPPPSSPQPPPARRAFVAVRPPGHHAEADSAGGFCIYNNVMVGVAHAQAAHGIERVAVLDFDVHHGNGDSDIAWCDPTRLYASSFEAGIYGGDGVVKRCDGLHGQILSCPLPAGSGSAAFRAAWARELLPAVRAFEPQAIFLSAGFDAHADDPLASLTLHERDFGWLTAEVAALGGGNVPIISVLEGGYNVDALERCARAHVRALIHS